MTYAGLTTADKPALLDAKARGAEWVARDKNIVLGGFKHEPTRKTIMLPNGTSSTTTWNDEVEDFWIELNDCDLSFITWSSGAVNIDLALAQIAEMEKNQAIKAVEGAVSAEQVCDNINDIPAADVEPVVRGEWIEMRDPYGDLTGWIHEECGHETQCASNYCSKCGAKMTFIERSGSGE